MYTLLLKTTPAQNYTVIMLYVSMAPSPALRIPAGMPCVICAVI